jgi:hypothetical protein
VQEDEQWPAGSSGVDDPVLAPLEDECLGSKLLCVAPAAGKQRERCEERRRSQNAASSSSSRSISPAVL